MLTDAILSVVAAILNALAAVLPVGTLDLPSLTQVGGWFGQYAGPLDHWFPVSELAEQLNIMVAVWMPAAITYKVSFWIYKHLPVLGKG